MNKWLEIIDHGDDPGRYTIVRGDGKLVTCNENGKALIRRTCTNPYRLVHDLIREYEKRRYPRILKPAKVDALLKKFSLLNNDD
ncbi:hypothetical protein [Spirosoma fluminis]